ncbi:MAG: DAK2 domain-containing protein, partial [Mesorhizobium sp.]
ALDAGSPEDAARAARRGAEGTAAMRKAKAGRSAYIGSQLDGIIDPGAYAVAEVFAAVAALLATA